jgi:hypothetical protein
MAILMLVFIYENQLTEMEDVEKGVMLESGTPRMTNVEADRGGDSVEGCIAHSTIAGQSVASGAGHAPARSGAHT